MKLYGIALLAAVAAALPGCDGGSAPRVAATAGTAQAADPDAPPEVPVMGPEVPILALGDSLFAGYGLKSGESYPARLEAALRARGINARIANAGVSGDTTAGGLQRLAFTLENQPAPPAAVLVSLGGNDMLRGLSPDQTRANLDAILSELARRKIKVVVMGMLAPPNMGAQYRGDFDAIYPELAKKHGAQLVPFFLQAVVGKPDLIQQDHVHPTSSGVEEIVAATVDLIGESLPPTLVAPPPLR
jgi:acyl-CoA thioesterase-1